MPIWVMTALQADRLDNLEIDFRCDKQLWRPPEDSHLLGTNLDSELGTPWFLKKRLSLRRLYIVRPPSYPTSTKLVDLAIRTNGPDLRHLEVRGGLDALWIPSSLALQNLDQLISLAVAVGDLEKQLPLNAFPNLVDLSVLVLDESQITKLPAYLRNIQWLPSLRVLHARFDELILHRFLEDEMREIHIACRDRGIRYYILYD